MRIALGQMDCVVGDVAANVATMVDLIADAAGRGCIAVWFPELADTGYALQQMPELAGAWPGPAYDGLAAAARRHGMVVGAGLSERAGVGGRETLYNSLVVLDADGRRVGHYRKAHLFAAGEVNEAGCFAGGRTENAGAAGAADDVNGVDTVELAGMRHGLSVCYDLRFPELYRQRTDAGATVLVNATAWPAVRAAHWDVLTRARAVENQAYFVGVGRVGEDAGIRFAGRSRVVAPTGEVVAEAGTDGPELVVAELDPAAVTAFRSAVPALAARRRDLFG